MIDLVQGVRTKDTGRDITALVNRVTAFPVALLGLCIAESQLREHAERWGERCDVSGRLPVPFVENGLKGVAADPQLGSKGVLRNAAGGIAIPHRPDLLCSETRLVVRLAPLRPLRVPSQVVASLARHVSQIVRIRPKKQVIRTNTGRVVAAVADKKPVRDRSIGEFPRYAVCEQPFAWSPAQSDLPIASREMGAGPQPAGSKLRADDRPILVDLLPESVSQGSILGSVAARATAIEPLTHREIADARSEQRAALLTRTRRGKRDGRDRVRLHRKSSLLVPRSRLFQQRGSFCMSILP